MRRFVLVDWYLLDPMDIDITGHTGIFGSNGSGKSSLIDGLQVVMTGVNRRAISLNASADDRHRARGRSIRDYCLGMVSDRKEGGTPHRDVAATRLALVFERPETGEVHTIGVVLSAEEGASGSSRADRENFSIDSLFIATDVALSHEDFVEWNGDEYLVLDWDSARDAIKRKASRFEEYKTSERYVSAVLALLRGETRAEPASFMRTFKNAVAFRPIDNPTDFVRRFVLEDKPVEVQRFRDSVRVYEEINMHIDLLEKREATLDEAEGRLATFLRTIDRVRLSSWISANAAHKISHRVAIATMRDLRTAENDCETAKVTKDSTTQRLEHDKQRLTNLQVELQQHDAAIKAAAKKNQITSAELMLERALAPMERARGMMASAANAAKFVKDISNPALTAGILALQEAYVAAGRSDIPIRTWPQGDLELDELRERLAGIDAATEHARANYEATLADRAEKKRAAEDAQARLAKARQGVAPLSDVVETLYAELQGAGVRVDHLHTLVRVTDPQWQDIIEAVLGRARETLMVPVEDTQVGTRYLRENRKRFYGCRIFNNARIEKFGAQPEAGTLASFVETDDIRARAFINQRLGNIFAVEDNRDLIKSRRAATADGMFNDGTTITSLRPHQTNILGKSASDMMPSLERMVDTLERSLPLLNVEVRESELRWSSIAAVKTFHEEFLPAFDQWRRAVNDAQWTLDELKQDLIAIEEELPRDLKEEHDQLASDIEERKREVQELEDQVLELANRQGEKRTAAKAARQTRNQKILKLADLRKVLTFGTRLRASEQLLEEQTKGGRTLQQIHEHHEVRSREEEKRISGVWSDFATAVRLYCGEYKRPQPKMPVDAPGDDSSVREIREWHRSEKEGVVQHALRQFRAEAADAQREMEEIFRTDFLAHLNDRFKQTQDILRRLNRRLKISPFNEELYQFTSKTNPEYEHIVRLVKVTTESPEIMTPLFQAASARELGEHAPLFEAMMEVKRLLSREDVKVEDFEDYRDYLMFEITVCDQQGNVKTTLSSRQEIGSGGERQVPFYVAIAASLASMYHGRINTEKSGRGLALALFDEAFNKLDSANMHACMDFFDNLGLQVLLAAPDEKRMEFTDNLDTIIDIERDRENNAVMIDVAYPGPELKRVLRATNPAYRPLDDFRDPVSSVAAK